MKLGCYLPFPLYITECDINQQLRPKTAFSMTCSTHIHTAYLLTVYWLTAIRATLYRNSIALPLDHPRPEEEDALGVIRTWTFSRKTTDVLPCHSHSIKGRMRQAANSWAEFIIEAVLILEDDWMYFDKRCEITNVFGQNHMLRNYISAFKSNNDLSTWFLLKERLAEKDNVLYNKARKLAIMLYKVEIYIMALKNKRLKDHTGTCMQFCWSGRYQHVIRIFPCPAPHATYIHHVGVVTWTLFRQEKQTNKQRQHNWLTDSKLKHKNFYLWNQTCKYITSLTTGCGCLIPLHRKYYLSASGSFGQPLAYCSSQIGLELKRIPNQDWKTIKLQLQENYIAVAS